MPPVKPRHAALEVAKRCACKPCREQVALAAERAIRAAEQRLLEALRRLVEAEQGDNDGEYHAAFLSARAIVDGML